MVVVVGLNGVSSPMIKWWGDWSELCIEVSVKRKELVYFVFLFQAISKHREMSFESIN